MSAQKKAKVETKQSQQNSFIFAIVIIETEERTDIKHNLEKYVLLIHPCSMALYT